MSIKSIHDCTIKIKKNEVDRKYGYIESGEKKKEKERKIYINTIIQKKIDREEKEKEKKIKDKNIICVII